MSGSDPRGRPSEGRSLVAVPRALVPQPIRDRPDGGAGKHPVFFVRKTGGQTTVSHRYRILGADDAWIVMEHVRIEQRWEARFYRGRGRPALIEAAEAWIDAKLGPEIVPALRERRWPLAAGGMAVLGLVAMLLLAGGDRGATVTTPISEGIEISLGDAPMPMKKPVPVVAPVPAPREQAKSSPAPVRETRAPPPAVARPEAEDDAAAAAAVTVPASRLESLPAARAAMLKAFGSGVATPWRGNGREGYVVVGPAQLYEDRACRNVVIWARSPTSDGETASLQKCMTRSGTLIDL